MERACQMPVTVSEIWLGKWRLPYRMPVANLPCHLGSSRLPLSRAKGDQANTGFLL